MRPAMIEPSPQPGGKARPRMDASCVTIGNFDGAHLGHQALIAEARDWAERLGLCLTVATFWPHPRRVLAQGGDARCLSSRAERERLLKGLGVDRLVEIPFTPAFAALSAQKFMDAWILPLNPRHIAVGHDFAFGHGRSGDFAFLASLGRQKGFTVSRAAPFQLHGSPISSTRLRQAVAAGDVEEASAMLGRRYAIEGIVEAGFGRGRGLGFPTANLAYGEALLPAPGVYAAFASLGGAAFKAVTNIGHNPTFNGRKLTVETFILNASQDLYGRSMRLEFVRRLREERKFASPEDLAAQIAQDVAQARAALEDAAGNPGA